MELNQEDAIGKKLRILREMHNFTQEQVAAELNLKQNAYNSLEIGETPLSLDTCEQLATIYKTKATDLFYYLYGNEKFIINNSRNSTSGVLGANQGVVTMHNYSLAEKEKTLFEKEIILLKEEIKLLKQQNKLLQQQLSHVNKKS